MEKLWAPWRISYIKSGTKKTARCVFCNTGKDKEHLIFTTAHSTALLNIFPYNNGHMLVCPKRHVRDLSKLSSAESLDLLSALETARRALQDALNPDGFNIGINVGRAGGAGIIGHLHIHIVPRWVGDTNFMPALYATKVISQALEELHKHLRAVLRKARYEGITVY